MAEKFELLGLLRATGAWEMLFHGHWEVSGEKLLDHLTAADPGVTVVKAASGATVIRREEFAAFRIRRFG